MYQMPEIAICNLEAAIENNFSLISPNLIINAIFMFMTAFNQLHLRLYRYVWGICMWHRNNSESAGRYTRQIRTLVESVYQKNIFHIS